MIEAILKYFPPRTHALTLVSDPDGLLADEGTLAALAERGFRIVSEDDPIYLRYRVEQAKPFTIDRPLVVITVGQVDDLPYDLWQQGHHLALSLNSFFPSLGYPVVRILFPGQRLRLSQAPPPKHPLGRQATLDYVLQHVFSVDFEALKQPSGLIAWLSDYHQQAELMPPPFANRVLSFLRGAPAYKDWPVEDLLGKRDTFASFLRDQWAAYVQKQTGQLLRDGPVRYLVGFETDHGLQDSLPRLVRTRILEPLVVEEPARLPGWARPAILAGDEDKKPRRIAELITILDDELSADLSLARWPRWQKVARAWAELLALRHTPGAPMAPAQEKMCCQIKETLDGRFLDWLRHHYSALAVQRLPSPHHVYHIPHFIAYERRQGGGNRIALLIMDCMALADWQAIGPVWRARNLAWRVEEQLLLAQIPSITAISRRALVTGSRPADLGGTSGSNRDEPQQWTAFWAAEGVPADACTYSLLSLHRSDLPVSDSVRCHALCLVCPAIDELVHGTTLGTSGVQAALRVWLEEQSPRLEGFIERLLVGGFTVYVTSDHGHVEALGMGQPSEGLIVETRSKRARLYGDRLAAVNVQRSFDRTILWGQDGLLPDDLWAIMPSGRSAFASLNETLETHGGPTLDELVVPLVTISRD